MPPALSAPSAGAGIDGTGTAAPGTAAGGVGICEGSDDAGDDSTGCVITPLCSVFFDVNTVRPILEMKKIAAMIAVVRLRKLAEPDEPNTLPAEPLPNAAPMSAPLPCCSSTRPIMLSAAMI